MKFPNLVYRCPGNHQRKGGTFDYLQVVDEDALDVAISEGWFKTLDEAIAGKHNEQPKVSGPSPTRAELEQKADELDIQYDGRTSDAKLLQKINDAIQAQQSND